MNQPVLDVPFGRRDIRLDVIRGIAVLLVVVFHSARIYPESGLMNTLWITLTNSVWCGVDLFFVLSGFLITGILLDSRHHEKYFINFYARRSLRIFPLFYGVLIGIFLILPLIAPQVRTMDFWQALSERQIWLWTYLQNFLQARGSHQLPGLGHFWTLAVEEQFYWVWPLIVYFIAPRKLLRVSILILLLTPILRIVLLSHGFTPWAIRELTFTRIDSLVWGATAAIILRNTKVLAIANQWSGRLKVASAAFLLGVVAIVGELKYESEIMVTVGYTAVACLFACLIFEMVQTPVPFKEPTFLEKNLAWLGTISYGLYVFHVPISHGVLAGLRKYTALAGIPRAITSFFITLALSCIVAFASWKLWEEPWLRLKKRFSYGSRKQASVSEAVAAER